MKIVMQNIDTKLFRVSSSKQHSLHGFENLSTGYHKEKLHLVVQFMSLLA